MNFNEAKKVLLLICLGESEYVGLMPNAVGIVQIYLKRVYGVRHKPYYDPRPYRNLDDTRAVAHKVLGELDACEKTMPNIAKFGIDYMWAVAGRPWVSVPASIRDLPSE